MKNNYEKEKEVYSTMKHIGTQSMQKNVQKREQRRGFVRT